jgi:hypothetical protein
LRVFNALIFDGFEQFLSSVDNIVDGEINTKIFHEQIFDIFIIVEYAGHVRVISELSTFAKIEFVKYCSEIKAILKI